jgi:solute carrier family 35 protein E3
VCIGVALATVNDFELNFWGTFHAVLGIISTSFYQIWVKTKQQDLGLNSYQLLFLQAPVSAIMVFLISFYFEPVYGPDGWMEYIYTVPNITAIGLSCMLAFLVNLSIFLVIGRTSPVAYNVLGHLKLCVILITGFLIFNEDTNTIKIFGTALTLCGVIAYTHYQQTIKSGWEQRENKDKNKNNTNTNNDKGHEQQIETVALLNKDIK